MLRRRLEQSIIISAQEGPNEEPITLLGHELGEESLAFRCFAPLDTAAMWSLQLRFWDRTVRTQARVTELRPYNGGWDGVMLFFRA